MRTAAHVLEDRSRDHLTSLFHARGWTVERINSDYGEDLIVRIVENGQPTPLLFFVQVKAVTRSKRLLIKNGRYLSVPLESKHLGLWRGFREPVVLAVWDASTSITYWQTIQAAIAVAERRAAWKRRDPASTRIWVPVENTLSDIGLQRISSRARAAWENLARERQGAKFLTEALREQLGLDISYDPQYGTLTIPEGSFVPRPELGPRMYYFGRAARDIDRLATILGTSHEAAFHHVMGLMLGFLKTVESGQPAIIRGPKGEIVDIWQNVQEAGEDFFRMLEQCDED